MGPTKIDVAGLLDRLDGGAALPAAPQAGPCGLPLLPTLATAMEHGRTYCDGLRHYEADAVGVSWARGRCPELRRREIRDRIATEERRLRGELDEIASYGSGLGFDGFDVRRHASAAQAFEAIVAFAAGRPPRRGVLLAGLTGLGKTRLLLASHFALLEAGVASEYIRSRELRRLFTQAQSFDEDTAHEARLALDLIAQCEAVHLDELGDVQDDERKRGAFAEGLKDLLDRRRGAWAVATNLTYEAAERHPDVGQKILSRLIGNAMVVRCQGQDYRLRALAGGGR